MGMTCYDCLHADVCYKIEHYGRNPKGEACKDFYHNTVELNVIDEALRKLDNILIKYDYGSNLTDDEIDYLVHFNVYFAGATMRDLERYNVETIGKILLAESTKKDKPDNRLLW